MIRLVKWLEKHGYNYERVNYGGDYFFGVSCHIEGIMVTLDRKEYFDAYKQAQYIKKYCERYGYKIITEGYNVHCSWLSIGKPIDVDILNKYWLYSGLSVSECEKVAHNYHLNEIYNTHHAQLDKELRAIMTRYEALYRQDYIKLVNVA